MDPHGETLIVGFGLMYRNWFWLIIGYFHLVVDLRDNVSAFYVAYFTDVSNFVVYLYCIYTF